MTEFVFLPDRKRGELAATAEVGSLNIGFLAAEDGTGVRATAAQATTMSDISAIEVLNAAPNAQILDFVAETGALRVDLRGEEGVRPAPTEGGAFYPIIEYQTASAQVRVGDQLLQVSSGPAAADFIHAGTRLLGR